MAVLEKLENSKVKVTIEIGAEEFGTALTNAYHKTKARYNVPGFRKGKAPRRMIEKLYGEGAFYEEAFELIYGEAYDRTVEELQLHPVERPSISIEKIEEAEGVVFTAEFTVRPEVLLGQYKGIEVEKRAYTVEDAELDSILERERDRVARYIEQDRAVENGDRVLLDYEGSVDGVPFDGGAAEDATLDIGSGTFIPGFEEQLIGMQKDVPGVIQVTFPEEYHSEELKGKAAEFAVTIKGIQVKELPELDDEFAQDISEFDTLAELIADKRAALEKRNAERAKTEMENAAIDTVVENATVDVPDVMVERQMDYLLQEMAYRLAQSGISLEDYCKYTQTSQHTLRENYREDAARRVRTQLVMDAVAAAEELKADDAALEKELREYAERVGEEYEPFRKDLSEDDLAYFRDRTVAQLTIDCIMDAAKLVDEKKKPAKKASGEEKPKKAAKKPEDAAEESEKKPAAKKAAKASEEEAEQKPAAKKAAKATDEDAGEKPAAKKKPAKAADDSAE